MNPSSSSASSPSSAVNSSSPSHSPNQKSETINQKSRKRARPFQTLPEFAALNRDQLAYIHDILRTKTLEDAQREIWTELGLQTRLDLCTLHRYKHKLLFAESLDLVDDATTAASAIDQLNDLLAGRPTKLSTTGFQVVQQRALALANDPKTKPSLFTNLHRIFTYEDRKAERDRTHQFRAEQAALLNTHRAAVLEHRKLAEQNRHDIALQREATRDQLAVDRIAHNAHKRALDLEKLKLDQARLTLDQRKQDLREKIAAAKIPNPNLDEEARLRAEGFLEVGRQVVARRRLAQSAATSANTSATGGAHSTVPHSLLPSSESEPLVPNSAARLAPCGAHNLSAHLNQNQSQPETKQTTNHTNP